MEELFADLREWAWLQAKSLAGRLAQALLVKSLLSQALPSKPEGLSATFSCGTVHSHGH